MLMRVIELVELAQVGRDTRPICFRLHRKHGIVADWRNGNSVARGDPSTSRRMAKADTRTARSRTTVGWFTARAALRGVMRGGTYGTRPK